MLLPHSIAISVILQTSFFIFSSFPLSRVFSENVVSAGSSVHVALFVFVSVDPVFGRAADRTTSKASSGRD